MDLGEVRRMIVTVAQSFWQWRFLLVMRPCSEHGRVDRASATYPDGGRNGSVSAPGGYRRDQIDVNRCHQCQTVTLFDGRIRHDAQIQDVNIELPIFEVGPKHTRGELQGPLSLQHCGLPPGAVTRARQCADVGGAQGPGEGNRDDVVARRLHDG